MALPIVLIRPEDQSRIEAQTQNVSCDSFCCVLDRPLPLDEVIDCELLIPGDKITSVPEPDLRLNCRVRVVRVSPRNRSSFEVACRLEDYSVTQSAS